ncbi:MAG: acyl-CoA dehydrogenase family protein [Micropepsaceae bacterium]
MADLEAFRTDVRSWLEANCPPSMRTPMVDGEVCWGGRNASYPNPETKLWLDAMASKGWTAPTWPAQYGGGGLTQAENDVLQSELRRIKARPALLSFGIMMFGPVLLEYGNEEQKKRFIPGIVKGEIRWCQGYSEPGAGSDLASLATKCEDKGDHWLINGQKIWTSYANYADWIFCLVRTDTTTKHEGISFIVFDMTSPGVETRPIALISGESPFCETFFTDVKVPKDQMVGKLNHGWEIAKRLLTYERTNISAGGFGAGASKPVDRIAKDYVGVENGKLADADLRARIARHKMTERAFNLTVVRTREMSESGETVGHLASVFKVGAANLNKEKTELVLEAMGNRSLGWSGDGFTRDEILAPRTMLRAKANSIEGGTTEINLNVVAKRVLGLFDHQ